MRYEAGKIKGATLACRSIDDIPAPIFQITKFDFSIIGTGILAHRSIVTEYRAMEEVFDTMCKALFVSPWLLV